MDNNSRQELENLINKIGSADANHSKLAPDPDFTGRSIQAVFNHFLALRDEDESIQPFYLIVADRADFKEEGVLGVCLDCNNEGNGDVGVARCLVDMADSWGADFYYGLAPWEQMRDEEYIEFGGDHEEEHPDFNPIYDECPGPVQLRSMYGCYSLVEQGLRTRVFHVKMNMADDHSCAYQSHVGSSVA